MLDRLVYWLALIVVTFVRWLPLAVCFVLGQGIGAMLWAILPGYRRLARENLASVFGNEMSPEEIRKLTFLHFTTLGANAVCAFKMPACSTEEIARHADMENFDTFKATVARGKGVVLAINHIGNWELYAQLIFHVPSIKFGTVYQALHNKQLDELINGDRRRLGVATFDRKKGYNAAIAMLREGGVVGVLVDQNAGDGGVWMPFFNRLASTSPLAAALAMRTGAEVLPIAIFTSGFAKWRVAVRQPIPWDGDDANKLSLDINRVLESQIRESPADWFWVHNRWKIPLPHVLTAQQKRGSYLPPENPPLRPFRFVVRSPNWLGDAVMSTAAARAFKLGRPDARLAILAPKKLAAYWRAIPEVDEVIETEESVFKTAEKLRGKFEVAVLFPNSLRSALEVWLAKIPRRIGYRGHNRAFFLNQIVSEPKKKKTPHDADRYWRIAERCGAIPVPEIPAPRTHVREQRVYGVCPGAEYGPAKRWPAERFREAMELVSRETACTWKILGTSADSAIAKEIAKNFQGSVEDLTGRTSLDGLIDELRGLDALLTNDTGTMHLADMLGVPLVAIFGSTEPALTGPRGQRSVVLRDKVECSPCFKRECPIDFRCMTAISPSQAASAVLELGKQGA